MFLVLRALAVAAAVAVPLVTAFAAAQKPAPAATKDIDLVAATQPRSDSEKALDEAVKGVVRDQAKAKGFEVKK